MLFLNGTREPFERESFADSSLTQDMDNERSDSSIDSTLSKTEINEGTLSGKTKRSMFARAISLESLPSSGQQEEDENNGVQCQENYNSAEGWERLGARPRDSQRQYSLPGLSTSAPLPPQQSGMLVCDPKAKYSQNGTIHEDDHGPEHTQMQLPLARLLPSPLPLQDGLAEYFIAKHSCDETILHRDTQIQHTQALPQVIGPEVSEGLEINFLAKHSQDDSILEDLYKDDISTQGVTALQAERDAGSVGNALNVDSTQVAVAVAKEHPAAETCEHYKRRCCAWFPCCEQFWPCHRCHNLSRKCGEAAASNATHLKCSKCDFVQEVENGATCQYCGIKMAAYFCWICKHLSNVDNDPYHCEKCGVCRSYRTKSFHCDICGVCMSVRSKNKHTCRPSSAHDECCICLEDTFSGCHVLPCSHKMHHKCYFKMRVLSNLDTCPICRQPISRSQRA